MRDPAWGETAPAPLVPSRSSGLRVSLRELLLVGIVVALACAYFVRWQRDSGWMELQWRTEQSLNRVHEDLWEHAFKEFGAKQTGLREFSYKGVGIAIEEEFYPYDYYRSCRFDAPLFGDSAPLEASMRFCSSQMFRGGPWEDAIEKTLADLEEIRHSTSGAQYASVREFDVEWVHVRIEAEPVDEPKRRVVVELSSGAEGRPPWRNQDPAADDE